MARLCAVKNWTPNSHAHTHTHLNPCASSNLYDAACYAGKHLADVVQCKKNKYRGWIPDIYSPLLFVMLTCGAVGSDVYGLIKELVIRRIEHRTEIHSNESHHLSEGTEV